MPKPIIPNLEEHIRSKITEIANMDGNASKSYDTAMTWAFIRLFYPAA